MNPNPHIEKIDKNRYNRLFQDETCATFEAIELEDSWDIIFSYNNNIVFNENYKFDDKTLLKVWTSFFLSKEEEKLKAGLVHDILMQETL